MVVVGGSGWTALKRSHAVLVVATCHIQALLVFAAISPLEDYRGTAYVALYAVVVALLMYPPVMMLLAVSGRPRFLIPPSARAPGNDDEN